MKREVLSVIMVILIILPILISNSPKNNIINNNHVPLKNNVDQTEGSRSVYGNSPKLVTQENRASFNETYYGQTINTWMVGPAKNIYKVITYSEDGKTYFYIMTDYGIQLLNTSNIKILGAIYNNITDIFLEDVNNDGSKDLLVGTSHKLTVLLKNSSELWTKDFFNITKIYAGSILPTEKIILVGLGNNHLVALNKFGEKLWDKVLEGVVSNIEIRDIDSDGLEEIIVADSAGYLYILSNAGEIKSTYHADSPITAMDISNDNKILLGTASGNLVKINAQCEVEWIKIFESKIVGIQINDIDLDANEEIVIGTESGTIYALKMNSTTLWQNNQKDTVGKLVLGNVQGDNHPEIVFIKNYERITTFLWNGTKLWEKSLECRVLDLNLFNLDTNPTLEIISGTNLSKIIVLNGSGLIINELFAGIVPEVFTLGSSYQDGNQQIVLVDRNRDLLVIDRHGQITNITRVPTRATEISLGNMDISDTLEISVGFINGSIISYDLTGAPIWNYTLSSKINLLLTENTDSDDFSEVFSADISGTTALIDNNGTEIWQKTLESNISDCKIDDINEDGTIEIIIGLENGTLLVINSSDGTVIWRYTQSSVITSLAVNDISDNNGKEIIFGTNTGAIFIVNSSGEMINNKTLSAPVSYVLVNDLNGDDNKEIIIATLGAGILILDQQLLPIRTMMNKGSIYKIVLGDANGDRMQEIIAINQTRYVTILNQTGEILWIVDTINLTQSIYSCDINLDGTYEVVEYTNLGIGIIDVYKEIWLLDPEPNGIYTSSNITVSWRSSGVLIHSYELYLDDNLVREFNYSETAFNISNLEDGQHKIEIRGIPEYGSVIRKSVSVTIDTTVPSVAIVYPKNGSYIGSRNMTVNWIGSDTTTGIDYYEIQINKTSWINVYKNTTYEFVNLTEGVYEVVVRAWDIAGLMNSTNITVIVDLNAPTLWMQYPRNNSYIASSNVHLQWNFSDASPVEFQLILDDREIYNTGRNTTYLLEDLSEGSHKLVIIGTDILKRTSNITIYFEVDTKKPELREISLENNSYVNSRNITLSWSAEDENIDYYQIFIDGEFQANLTKPEYAFNATEGQHKLKIIAIDKAGNLANVSILFIVDITPPEINLMFPSNWYFFNTSRIQLIWNGSDNIGLKRYWLKVNNSAWYNLGLDNTTEILDLKDGVYLIYLIAEDFAGNYQAIQTVVVVDTKKPIIEITLPKNDTIIRNSSIEIEWTYVEQNPYQVTLMINDSQILNLGLLTEFTFENLSSGYYEITVLMYDQAGNIGYSRVHIVIDTIPPIFIEVQPANNTIINTTYFRIQWIVSDEYSDIAYVVISLDDIVLANVSNISEYTIYTSGLDEGYHVILLQAFDLVGNSNTYTLGFYYIPTKSGPTKEIFPIQTLSLIFILMALLGINVYLRKIRRK
ncbi:MAG: PQQ-binding-like beta-propeller repeat protein [Candidatus Njordarchaeum guaymaensis]